MSLVYRQWSGKHHQIVNGINLETVVWTNNEAIVPVDFRIYETALRSFSTAKDSRRSNEKVDVIKVSTFRRIYCIQLKDFFEYISISILKIILF
jgi:hypothetical protein